MKKSIDYKYIRDNWNKLTYKEMAEHLGMTITGLHTAAYRMRKNGIKLPRKPYPPYGK